MFFILIIFCFNFVLILLNFCPDRGTPFVCYTVVSLLVVEPLELLASFGLCCFWFRLRREIKEKFISKLI